jgi:hypothetical protein
MADYYGSSNQFDAPQAPNNQKATISMIVGIVTWVLAIVVVCPVTVFTGVGGIICFPILLIGWIVGLVLGNIARREIRESGGQQQGDGAAKAGVIMGWIGLGFSVLSIIVSIAVAIIGGLALSGPAIQEIFSDIVEGLE